MGTVASTTPRNSTIFNAEDAEITFRSSDNVQYRIHLTNLKACSTSISPPEGSTLDEIVQLSESSTVLDYLFAFIYPRKHPYLKSLDFYNLLALAEAAEKYQVHFARHACKQMMHLSVIPTIPSHNLLIFGHAAKHGYKDLMSEVAPLLVDLPLEKIITNIPTSCIIPWCRYQDHWTQASRRALTSHLPPGHIEPAMIIEIARNPRCLVELGPIFQAAVEVKYATWRSSIGQDIKAIPKFSDVLPKEDALADSDLILASDQPSVTFQSPDGTLFPINHQLLLVSTAGFGTSADTGTGENEHISLPEDTPTLTLLFKFFSISSAPDLRAIKVDALEQLAYAAEKYQVYCAMSACRIQMACIATAHPYTVFRYAAKYSHRDLLNETAPAVVIDQSLEEIVAILPSDLVVPWVQYHEKWTDVTRTAAKFLKFQPNVMFSISSRDRNWEHRICRVCARSGEALDFRAAKIVSEFAQGPRSLNRLDSIFDSSLDCCPHQREDLNSWRSAVKNLMSIIPPFKSFF